MLRDVSGYWMEKFHNQINVGNPELIKVKPVVLLWAFNKFMWTINPQKGR